MSLESFESERRNTCDFQSIGIFFCSMFALFFDSFGSIIKFSNIIRRTTIIFMQGGEIVNMLQDFTHFLDVERHNLHSCQCDEGYACPLL